MVSCGDSAKKGTASNTDAASGELPKSDPNNPRVLIETSMGDIKVELFEKEAPNTVKNFLRYVEDKHYDGTIFHRVIKNFMIQGGGFTPEMTEKETRAPILNEAGGKLSNLRGTIAMARTNNPHSATDQFFINVVDNRKGLDQDLYENNYGYAVFGMVVEGMDVVDKIRAVPTGTRMVNVQGKRHPFEDVPESVVKIKSIRVVK
jgi:cyclophilin family peptidyl-prolyl cis-trans isomerase